MKVSIDKEEVLRMIDCHKGSTAYEEVVRLYEEMEEEMLALCEPVFLLEYGEFGKDNMPVFFVIYSVGRRISEFSTASFQSGDYLKGMLANAMADSALFSLERNSVQKLKEACAWYQKGIKKRLEAPKDIPIESMEVIFRKTKAQEKCGINLTSGFMLDPVKSNAVIYALSDDPNEFLYAHDCRNCDLFHCKMRSVPDIPVEVLDKAGPFTIMVREGQTILEALMKKESAFSAICGGTGRCGKCKIRVVDGELAVTDSDIAVLSEEERGLGYRLACKACPASPMQIELCFQREEDFFVVTDYREVKKQNNAVREKEEVQIETGIAIDLGTTTIAIQIVSLQTGDIIATHTDINHQRQFGADVISRIKASTEGQGENMREVVRNDLYRGIRRILEQTKISSKCVKKVVVAGNTTMIHLLLGYDCAGLGSYPFTPISVKPIEIKGDMLLGELLPEAYVRIFPGISAFVGGDIVAGLCHCGIYQIDGCFLLIDLGTNAEMAIGGRKGILVASAAAGPAFEGGNITYGVGSVEGAITNVTLHHTGAVVQTIGNKAPIGICGTGVVELAAELLRIGVMDEAGYLSDYVSDEGYPVAQKPDGSFISITQQDIRELQLAKSAIRAGIETLCLHYGAEKKDITQIFLAGGFGQKLDVEKAIQIGMFPEEFQGKICAVGNSALGGAVKCLFMKDMWREVCQIPCMAREIDLSQDKEFQEYYMKYMCFE